MFHKAVRQAHFTYLKTKLSGFNFLAKEFHDTTLDFKTRLHRYITENNNTLSLSNNPWLGILWNRTNIEEPDVLTGIRKFKFYKNVTIDPEKPKAEKYDLRMASTKMSLAIYSNDIDYLETVEEYLYLLVAPHHVINVVYSNITNQPFKIFINDFTRGGFIKEERGDLGTLAKLLINYEMVYPIIKLDKEVKLIKEVIFKIKLEDLTSEIEL